MKTTTAPALTDDLIPMDFVYGGRRLTADGKLALAILPIHDGLLLDERWFTYDRKSHRTVGGVYSGAKFSKTSALGLKDRSGYVRMWEHKTDLIDWRARDEHAEVFTRSRKLEADAKKINEIERIMLPLRAQMERYRVMRDRPGIEALRGAVMAALCSAPRPDER